MAAAVSDHTCVLTRLPSGDVACMLTEKACRKLVKLAVLPVPPMSLINLLNAVCSVLVAVPLVEVVSEVPVVLVLPEVLAELSD